MLARLYREGADIRGCPPRDGGNPDGGKRGCLKKRAFVSASAILAQRLKKRGGIGLVRGVILGRRGKKGVASPEKEGIQISRAMVEENQPAAR